MTRKNKTAMGLAIEHWNWIESTLFQQRQMEKKLFMDAFLHGYKHGKEDK